MIFYIFIVLIIIIIFFCPIKRKKEIKGNLIYLNKEEAADIYRKYSVCHHMKETALIHNFGAGATKETCLLANIGAIMEFTPAEKQLMDSYYLDKRIKRPDFPIKLIKIRNDFGFTRWYTMGADVIVAPADDLTDLTQEEFIKIINHEVKHLDQRRNAAKYRALYLKMGMTITSEVDISLIKVDNPDDPPNIWYLYPFGEFYLLTALVFDPINVGSVAVYLILLDTHFKQIAAWDLLTAPEYLKKYIVDFWRRYYPSYSMDDLLNDGYSPNEILAHLNEAHRA